MTFNPSLISRAFTHITIPSEIWLRRDISIQAKALWAELRSLHDLKKGGCWASDEYLMEFMILKRSRLHELYKELKDHGLMEVVSFDGRQTIRKAIVPEVQYQEETGQQVSGIPDSCYPENRTPEIRKTGLPPYIEKREKNKDIGDTHPLISFGSHVKIKQEAYESLVKEHGKAKIDDQIKKMNDYCLAHGKTYKDYSAALRIWMKNNFDSPKSNSKTDRRTQMMDGTPAPNPYEGLF